jgi:mannose-6-phosphate isomerase-like protein (cupin superfamily)
MTATASPPVTGSFQRDGYLGPVRLFDAAECRRIAAYLARTDLPAPAEWGKGRAVREPVLHGLATRPELLALVRSILGDDVILWGASAVMRGPGDVHPWHSDIESSAPDGRFVTVWIGIENTSRESALQVISRSHLLGKTVQEARLERGLKREEATPEAMLGSVKARHPDAELIQADMTNGDALLFDGRLWHGSDNTRQEGRRVALLFQYAAAECAVRIPDLSQLDWPFKLQESPLPPVIAVAGSAVQGPNRIVPAPAPDARDLPMLVTAVHEVVLPLENPPHEWQAFPGFRGATRTLAEMSCHASVLAPGHSPHPPHAHQEEEILIPLHGEVELVIARSPGDRSPRIERLSPGSFVYYPAGQHHTIRNSGSAPVGYLMFKWRAGGKGASGQLGTTIVHHAALEPPAEAPPFWTRPLLDGPTAQLGKLHSHLTVLAPGGTYEAHADPYDVAFVVLSGTIETIGATAGPRTVLYCAADESHGMRNPGTEAARYLVFEFHPPAGAHDASARPFVVRAGKRLLRPVWRRIKPMLPRAIRERW